MNGWTKSSANLPPKNEAGLWAKVLARAGVNCVRFHFLDLTTRDPTKEANRDSIRARAAREAEVWIYGDIGESWSAETVTARQFVADLQKIEADRITVRINSVGGSVPDGLAIYNAIKRHPAAVTVAVDGVAGGVGRHRPLPLRHRRPPREPVRPPQRLAGICT